VTVTFVLSDVSELAIIVTVTVRVNVDVPWTGHHWDRNGLGLKRMSVNWAIIGDCNVWVRGRSADWGPSLGPGNGSGLNAGPPGMGPYWET